MGLLKTIGLAILGPLLIYAVLIGHIVCRVFLQTPDAIQVQEWDKSMPKEVKDAVISTRKPLIKDFMDTVGSKMTPEAFAKKYVTDDADWEDPFEKYTGKKEFTNVLKFWQQISQNSEFAIHGEYHSPHEILMDWTITSRLKWLPNYPISVSMRSHILLEQPPKIGSPEKIFRIYEEWRGNKLITEKTTVPFIGKIHQQYRKFFGSFAGSFM